MAVNKNITMKQYNGTDYDTLYPTTTIGQVRGLSDEFNNFLPIGTIMGNSCHNFPNKMPGAWYLCDGSFLESAEYPDFVNSYSYPFTHYSSGIENIDGYYISGSFKYGNTVLALSVASSGGYTYIQTSRDGGRTWTRTYADSLSSPKAMYCYEGTWCIGTENGKVYCSTDNAENWTSVDFTSFNPAVESIYCYNGLWCLTYFLGIDSSYIAYSRTPSVTSSWANVKLNFYGTSVKNVYCYNGIWVALCSKSTYFISTDNCATWEKKIIDSSNGKLGLNGVYCYEGTWGILAYDSDSLYIYYGNDISNPSTFNKIVTYANRGNINAKCQLICVNGNWYFMTYNTGDIERLYYTNDLDAGFSFIEMPAYYAFERSTQFMFEDSGFFNSIFSLHYSPYGTEYFTNAKFQLPNLSGDKVDYYIKIK